MISTASISSCALERAFLTFSFFSNFNVTMSQHVAQWLCNSSRGTCLQLISFLTMNNFFYITLVTSRSKDDSSDGIFCTDGFILKLHGGLHTVLCRTGVSNPCPQNLQSTKFQMPPQSNTHESNESLISRHFPMLMAY